MSLASNLVNDYVIQDSYGRGLLGRPNVAGYGTSAQQAYDNGAATRRAYRAKIIEAQQKLAAGRVEDALAKQA